MKRRKLVATLLLVAAFVALLVFGIYHGDAKMVLENAQAFCFT